MQMDRESRLEAMCMAESGEVVALADEVMQDFEVDVTRGPSTGLLMVRMEEPSERIAFNFTEVTVSEAEVSAGGQRGYAMVMGRDPEKALALAVLDAAAESSHHLSGRIEQLAQVAIERDEADWRQRWSLIAPSTASFEDVTE